MKAKFLILVGAAMMLAGPAFAHHSFAMFDFSKEVTVVGEVKEFLWRNPHMHILMNVSDGKGGIVEYDIEGGTPNNLRRNGWTADTLKPGDKISVVMRPLKNGDKGGNFIRANRGDGTPIGNTGGGRGAN
ncbi:MAG TPA: DUF6152 family protein [Terriglobia bacterium]|nr:DUF6152 family protein [Terriglobia bacterium]